MYHILPLLMTHSWFEKIMIQLHKKVSKWAEFDVRDRWMSHEPVHALPPAYFTRKPWYVVSQELGSTFQRKRTPRPTASHPMKAKRYSFVHLLYFWLSLTLLKKLSFQPLMSLIASKWKTYVSCITADDLLFIRNEPEYHCVPYPWGNRQIHLRLTTDDTGPLLCSLSSIYSPHLTIYICSLPSYWAAGGQRVELDLTPLTWKRRGVSWLKDDIPLSGYQTGLQMPWW